MRGDALWFEMVELQRMPGFESGGFTIDGFGPGVNLVSGPNGSGKSTLARAMQALLWKALRQGGEMVAAEACLGASRLRLDLYANRLTTLLDGVEGEPPAALEQPDRYLLALPDLLTADDRDLAARLHEEASGGYRLAEVADRLGRAARPGRPTAARNAWRDAAAKVAELRQAAARLSHEGESRDLPARLAELAAAEAAAQRVASLEQVLALRQARQRVVAAEAAFEAFAESVRRLDGSEGKRLAELDGQVTQATGALAETVAEQERLQREIDSAALPEGGVSEPARVELTALDKQLSETAKALAAAEQELAAASQRVDQVRSEIAPELEAERLAELIGEGLGPLSQWVREAQRLAALDEMVERAKVVFDVEPAAEPAALRQALEHLQRWIVAQGAPQPPPLWPAMAAVLAALAGGAGLAPARLEAGWGWALAAGGLTIAALLVVFGWRRRRPDPGQSSRDAYEATGLAAPEAWTVDLVMARADRLRGELAAAHLVVERRQSWERLGALRDEADKLRRTVAERRDALCTRFGLPTELEPLEVAQLHDQLRTWRQAALDHAARLATVEHWTERAGSLRADLAALLQPFGYPPGNSAAVVHEQVAALGGRSERWRQAQHQLQPMARRAAQQRSDCQRLKAQWDGLFERCGLAPGDRLGLGSALAEQPDCAAARQALDEAKLALKLAHDALPDGDPWADDDDAALQGRLEDARGHADRRAQLAEAIGALREQVRQAEGRQEIEAALAAQDDALAQLADRRDADADALVTDLLASHLEQQLRDVELPLVFRRAEALYGELTRGRYRLRLASQDGQARFNATDLETGRVRELRELSSGNRVQLLLAVRLASIEADEAGGARLPLWLDEAMGTSDDDRTRAIIEAVSAVAASGRQVIYLTAQADEVAKWRRHDPEAVHLELAAIRKLPVVDAAPAIMAEPEPIPAPGGAAHDSYGLMLGVSALGPWQPAETVHLWYAVDDPALLHRLLEVYGMTSWATYAERVRTAGHDGLGVSEAEHRRAVARMRVLEALVRAWRQGRSRPVDAEAVRTSPLGTSKYLPGVMALAADCIDAADFCARLTDVDGIGRGKAEQMEAHLEAEGYLADGEPLEREALLQVGLTAATAALGDGVLSRGEVEWLVDRLP